MTGREWTGSVSVLPESMDALAVEMANLGAHDPDHDAISVATALETFLRDHAYTLSEWAAAVRELYVRLDEGEHVTNAQGVAMARLLRNASTLRVTRVDPSGSPFLGFEQTYEDGRVILGGIEPDGSVGT